MGKILIIDSGIGGVSTLGEILMVLPFEEYIYFADKAFMPYGDKDAVVIRQRMEAICQYFFEREEIKAVVIACNTATACGIEYLRKRFLGRAIFVGVEPAIKPAVEGLSGGKVLVLVTPSTAVQPKFLALLNKYKDCVILAPMPDLASLIENNIHDLNKISKKIENTLTPFKGQGIKSVVLGCTHYCFAGDIIARFLNAKTFDGNHGTAMQLYNLLTKQIYLLARENLRPPKMV